MAILPDSANVQVGGQQAFAAAVTGAVNTAVTWTVQEGAAGGTVTAGSYTAPGAAGTFHVVATSVVDPTKSAVATVTVTVAPPPADAVPPVVNTFAASGTSSPVSVTAFTASDNVAVTGYAVTESATPPPAGSAAWSAQPPASYATTTRGAISLYPWAKDAAGNVSAAFGAPVPLTLAAPAFAARMGTNLNWMTDWDPEKLPADLMWSARPWATGDGNGDNAANWAPLDARGWPIVTAGTTFGAIFEGSPFPGTYKLSFKNRQGTTGDTVTSYSGNIALQNRVHNAATNVTTYDVVVPSYANQFIWLRWAGSTGGVTDVHLMRPLKDGSGWHAIGTPLADYVIDRLKSFSAIRTMQTQGGQSGKSAGVDSTWADRTSPWGPQTRSRGAPGHKGGVAIENLVAMANQAQKDLWINVPFNADDDYITKMALAIRYGTDGTNPYTTVQSSPVFAPLAPNLAVYVEHGNEIWNSGAGYWEGENESAAQAAVNAGDPYYLNAVVGGQAANDSGVPGWGWRRTGYLAVRHSLLFRQVFGDAQMMTRVRPVLATQHGRYGTTLHPLRYVDAVWGASSPYATVGGYTNPRRPVSYYLYGLATAPYTPSSNGGLDVTSPATMIAGTYADITTNTAGYVLRAMTDNAGFASQYGIKFLAYEGGNNLMPSLMPGGATAATLDKAKQASFDPVLGARMGANVVGGLPAADQTNFVYGAMFQKWEAVGAELFMHFTLGEAATADSMFGLSPPSNVPALIAIPGWDATKGQSSSDTRYEYGPRWDAIKAFHARWGG